MWGTASFFLLLHCSLTAGQGEVGSGESDFRWETVHGSCSETCGPSGFFFAIILCEEVLPGGGRRTVDENMCDSSIKPRNPGTFACNRVPCEAAWKATPWGECSATCDGAQVRTVICEQLQGDGRGVISVEEINCTDPKPISHRSCSADCPNVIFKWVLTDRWTECSSLCGTGTRSKQVECVAESKDGSMEVVLNEICERRAGNSNPMVEETCSVSRKNHIWVASQWFKCSKPCGGGVTRRQVKCVHGCSGRLMGAGSCLYESRPAHTQVCNDFPCDSDGCQDQSNCLCRVVEKFHLCTSPEYSKICCRSCRRLLTNYVHK
eukprot:m.306593 g.306593  ORF g.306593 m.306593 type:complete len:321 (+) comp41384_c0_seq1:60-1022(+)